MLVIFKNVAADGHHPPTQFQPRNAVESLQALFSDPTAWAALAALVIMEVVLGIDT